MIATPASAMVPPMISGQPMVSLVSHVPKAMVSSGVSNVSGTIRLASCAWNSRK